MNSRLVCLIVTRLGSWVERESEGQGLVEYAMVLMLVALACVGAVTALGDTMKTTFWDVIENVLVPVLGG